MQPRRVNALSLAPAMASALLGIGVMTVFSACGPKDDGSWMRCHDAQLVLAGCAAAMTVVLVAAALVGNGRARAVLYGLGAVGAVVCLLVPGGIVPMCMMQTMRCYQVMQPFARIMAVVVLALCAVCAFRSWRGAAQGGPEDRSASGPAGGR